MVQPYLPIQSCTCLAFLDEFNDTYCFNNTQRQLIEIITENTLRL